jgi:hypothetical protein
MNITGGFTSDCVSTWTPTPSSSKSVMFHQLWQITTQLSQGSKVTRPPWPCRNPDLLRTGNQRAAGYRMDDFPLGRPLAVALVPSLALVL